MSEFKILFSATTPLGDAVGTVMLHEHIWERHIKARHPEMEPYLKEIEETVKYPTSVMESKTEPGNLVFINQEVTDPDQNALRVPIRPEGDGTSTVRTAYFSGNVTNAGKLLWHRYQDMQKTEKK